LWIWVCIARIAKTRICEHIEGVEVSSQQAERARRSGLNVSVVENTRDRLDARPGHFSAILLLGVLEHVAGPLQIPLLRSIFRSLRPDGRVIVQVPNANAILASRWRYNDPTHYCSFTEHSLYFVLRNAGFENIQINAEKGIGCAFGRKPRVLQNSCMN
jgi:SAM-dependent methyltransferase